MALYLSRISGTPVTVDPAPGGAEPPASRVFRTRARGNQPPALFIAAKGGAPVGTLWARMDGVEWVKLAGADTIVVAADTVAALPACPSDVDLFFQVTTPNAATDVVLLQSVSA